MVCAKFMENIVGGIGGGVWNNRPKGEPGEVVNNLGMDRNNSATPLS